MLNYRRLTANRGPSKDASGLNGNSARLLQQRSRDRTPGRGTASAGSKAEGPNHRPKASGLCNMPTSSRPKGAGEGSRSRNRELNNHLRCVTEPHGPVSHSPPQCAKHPPKRPCVGLHLGPAAPHVAQPSKNLANASCQAALRAATLNPHES